MANRPDDPADGNPPSTFAVIGYDQWYQAVGAELESPLAVEGVDIEPMCTAGHPERLEGETGVAARANPDERWVVCQRYSDDRPENLNQYLKDDLENGVAGIRLRGSDFLGDASSFARALSGIEEAWRVLMLDAGGIGRYTDSGNALLDWVDGIPVADGTRTLLLGADSLAVPVEGPDLEGQVAELDAGLAALVRRAQGVGPEVRAITVSTEACREYGADLVQELGAALATAVHYLRCLERSGMALELSAAQVAFVTATGQQVFPEIGKLRALRWLWRRVLVACGLHAPPPAWIHAAILRHAMVESHQADNHLRATTAAMAAAVGGADSIEIPGAVLAQPGIGDDDGRVLGRNTQLVLDLEAHLAQVRDPAAGSYLLESLTMQLAARGWGFFRQIEEQGGIVDAHRTGWLRERMAESRQRHRAQLDSGEIQIMGLNVFRGNGAG